MQPSLSQKRGKGGCVARTSRACSCGALVWLPQRIATEAGALQGAGREVQAPIASVQGLDPVDLPASLPLLLARRFTRQPPRPWASPTARLLPLLRMRFPNKPIQALTTSDRMFSLPDQGIRPDILAFKRRRISHAQPTFVGPSALPTMPQTERQPPESTASVFATVSPH